MRLLHCTLGALLAALLVPSLAIGQVQQPSADPSATASAATPPLRLIPAAREVVSAELPQRFRATIGFGTLTDPQDRVAAREFVETMRERGFRAEIAGAERASSESAWLIELHRTGTTAANEILEGLRIPFDPAMLEEGYVLVADERGAHVIAASDVGIFYGLQTLKQLFSGAGEQGLLSPATIRDWPAMRWRGVQDDLSRGPVPTLEFQKRQIRRLAAFKINVFSPYFEHTLAFRSQPLIAPPNGAMSRDDVRDLVEYASRFHVMVIPQQQTFGHLHHALKFEIYSSLAETPHGHVLAPGQPGSLALTSAIYAEIDSLFPAPFLHLGADETFELGKGQTKSRVDANGVAAVYVQYLRDIEGALRRSGKRFLFWGDIATDPAAVSSALIATLPKDMTAVGWNYDLKEGFDRYLKPFRDVGMETWIAPGVSNWSRVWPNHSAALPNIQGFAREGQAAGATGMLNTTWDDNGDAIFNQNWFGVLFGAAAAWQPGESSIPLFQSSFGSQFHGDTTGRIDAAHRHLTAAHVALQESKAGDASSYLFFVDPYTEEGVVDLIRLRPVLSRVRIHAESALVLIAQAREQKHLRERDALTAMELGARRIDWIGLKFQLADEIAQSYALTTDPARTTPVRWVDLADLSGINGKLQDMRDGYVLTRELFERAWLLENRPYWLQNNLARYDAEIMTWVQRINAMDRARRRHARDRKLPTAAEIGIPASLLAVPPRQGNGQRR